MLATRFQAQNMKQLSENSVEFNIHELQAHPDILINFLTSQVGIGLNIMKYGDSVIVDKKEYSPDFLQLMEESDQELERRKKNGYSREQAFEDFEKVHKKVIKQMYG